MSFEGRLTDPEAIRKFALAGNARLTLVSERTGVRFTFKVRQALDDRTQQPKEFWFVSLLNGSDNESDFAYLGTVDRDWNYGHGRKSRIGPDAPSAKAFNWLWRHIRLGQMPKQTEVWHEGRCGRCARPLTVPASIETGFGPDCAEKLGL